MSLQANDLPQAKQHLEEALRMSRSLYGDGNHWNHSSVAEVLHQLGRINGWAGDDLQAKQLLEESLRTKRSLYGDRDHRAIAETLHELGYASERAGDLPQQNST